MVAIFTTIIAATTTVITFFLKMPSNNIEGAGNGKAPRPKGNQVRFTPIRRSSTPLAPTLSVSPTGMQQRKRLMPTFSDYELYKKQLSEANLQQAQVGSNVGSVSALDATPVAQR